MTKLIRISLVILSTAVFLPWPAVAQEPTFIATHRDWHAYQFVEGGNIVCYMATKPTDQQGDYSRRGDVFLLVTHRPAESSRDVVSVITGYTFGPESEVEVAIGDRSFNLFTDDNTAWARDEATDLGLVTAMKAGSNMTVKGTSNRGTLTTDTYSLLGFTAAYGEISTACGL